MQLSGFQAVSHCAPAFRLSDSWFSRWGLWSGPPGAIILMMAWSACLCSWESACLQRRLQAAVFSLLPWNDTLWIHDILQFIKKKLFHLHRNLSNLTLSPTHETGKINCIMPILWIRIIYSGDVDLPKMQSVVHHFPGSASGKEPTCQCRRYKSSRFDPWLRKIPCRRKWQPTPVFLPGESQGLKHLAGYSP